MPTQDELIATGRDDEEIARIIGADALIYQDIEDMKKSISDLNPKLTNFDTSCFTGEYVAGDITPEYLARIAIPRDGPERGTGLQFNLGFAANDNQ